MRVNITIQIEATDKRRSVNGSILFPVGANATEEQALDALEHNGFHRSEVADGWKRNLYQMTRHFGGQHFEFFISDEVIPPAANDSPAIRGAEVPADVIEAQKKGSGFSGRTVPIQEATQ